MPMSNSHTLPTPIQITTEKEEKKKKEISMAFVSVINHLTTRLPDYDPAKGFLTISFPQCWFNHKEEVYTKLVEALTASGWKVDAFLRLKDLYRLQVSAQTKPEVVPNPEVRVGQIWTDGVNDFIIYNIGERIHFINNSGDMDSVRRSDWRTVFKLIQDVYVVTP
jgi:hypothetical protein